MSKSFPALAAVLASTIAFGLGAPVMADPEGPAKGRGAGFFERLDSDKDGKLSRAEFNAPRLERLRAMDPDGDGTITLEEMKAMARARAERQAEARFKALDLDGDGKIGAAEALMAQPAFERRGKGPGEGRGKGPGARGFAGGDIFGRLDADKDGFVTPAEMAAARSAMMQAPRRADRDGRPGHGHPRPHAPHLHGPHGAPAAGADKPDAN